jgi:hypothetical protein
MLSKCANPECNKPFLYLCQGKLFRFEIEERDMPGEQHDSIQKFQRIRRRVEYYWLCESCSLRMTIEYRKTEGVATVLIPTHRAAS